MFRCQSVAWVVPHWKALFGKQCVSEVVTGILTARPPKYSIIVELDRKIRDMELPRYAIDPPPEGAPFSVVMQHFMPGNYRCLSASSFLRPASLFESNDMSAGSAPLCASRIFRAGPM